MTYLIGLSGPPRAGKDSIGNALVDIIREKHAVHVEAVALSLPLRRTVYTMMGAPYTREHYEANKDVEQVIFDGRTIREAMIKLAEEHIRPTYGVGFFARSVINNFGEINIPDVVVITDMGFPAEVEAFEAHFGVDNCLWPQIIRPKHGFENDSRTFVGNPSRTTAVINEGVDVSQIEQSALCIYGRALLDFGWKFS